MLVVVSGKQMAVQAAPVAEGQPELDRNTRHLLRSHSSTFSTFWTAVWAVKAPPRVRREI